MRLADKISEFPTVYLQYELKKLPGFQVHDRSQRLRLFAFDHFNWYKYSEEISFSDYEDNPITNQME